MQTYVYIEVSFMCTWDPRLMAIVLDPLLFDFQFTDCDASTQMSMYRILIFHANLNPFEFYLIHPTSVDLSNGDITEHDFLLL